MYVAADKRNEWLSFELALVGGYGDAAGFVIAKTFTLDQIADAHAYLESNQQLGKIVVTVPGAS